MTFAKRYLSDIIWYNQILSELFFSWQSSRRLSQRGFFIVLVVSCPTKLSSQEQRNIAEQCTRSWARNTEHIHKVCATWWHKYNKKHNWCLTFEKRYMRYSFLWQPSLIIIRYETQSVCVEWIIYPFYLHFANCKLLFMRLVHCWVMW